MGIFKGAVPIPIPISVPASNVIAESGSNCTEDDHPKRIKHGSSPFACRKKQYHQKDIPERGAANIGNFQ